METRSPESRTVRELEAEVKKSIGLLKTLRDEIRVELHLARLEAMERWEKTIEPKINDIEIRARRAKGLSWAVVEEVLREARKFREDLKVRPS